MGKELDLDDVAAQSDLAKSELAALREDAARIAKERDVMRSVLEVSRGNVLSIKSAVGIGVITYDIWLREINTALGIKESNAELTGSAPLRSPG